jgi:quinoprotein relay system zinc metallohydrolase 2
LPPQISALRGLLCATLLSFPGPAPSSPPGSDLEIVEIAAGVFVHQGVHARLDEPRHDDIANIGFVIGERCVAVIDTGGSIAIGRALLDAVRSTTDRPVCYVINTHIHYDHLLGNAAFRETGARFVGHAALPDAMAVSRDFFLERFAADLGPGAGPEAIVAPGILVEEHAQLDLGNRVIELTAHRAAHTTSDVSVYDPRTGTLWTGDLVFVERAPVLDGSLRGWLDALARLESVKAERIVPGHGPASAPWPGAAADLRRYLERVAAEVRNGIAAGRFLEDLIDTAALDERDKWLLFDEAHRRNLTRAFTELEWE